MSGAILGEALKIGLRPERPNDPVRSRNRCWDWREGIAVADRFSPQSAEVPAPEPKPRRLRACLRNRAPTGLIQSEW